MILVDEARCAGCGRCAEICHERCINLAPQNGRSVPQIDHHLCSTCTQCIAICPRRALTWDGVAPKSYDDSRLPSAAQLEELLKRRRTIRTFKPERLPRDLAEEIVSFGSVAPTNNYHLRAILMDDPATLASVDRIVMRWVTWAYRLFYRPKLVFGLLKRLTPALDDKARAKMRYGVAQGRGWDEPPAAMVMIVGDHRVLFSEASAQFAVANIIFVAQTHGIGSRINGGITMIVNRSRATRDRLGLARHERVLGAVELGYPAVHFRNKVEGKAMPITWVGGERHG